MSEEEKKAIEGLKKILEYWQTIVDIKDPIEREIEMSMYSEEMPFYQIKQVLNLIEKQNKVIDLLIGEIHSIVNLGEFIDLNINKLDFKEEIKQYFYKKVEVEDDIK